MTEQKTVQLQLKDLLSVGLTLVVVGLVLAFGSQINGEVRDDIGTSSCSARSDGFTAYNDTSELCSNSSHTVTPGTAQFNATADTAGAMTNLTAKIPTLATVLIAAIIIGVLISAFAFGRMR